MELQNLIPDLAFQCDKTAANSIITDLTWATENCSVMAKHQTGEALIDDMGMGKVEP